MFWLLARGPIGLLWETLFDVPRILDACGFGPATDDVAELGYGYATFTVPLATRIRGTVHGIDIDAVMVEQTLSRARAAGVANVRPQTRYILVGGFGVPSGSCDAVLQSNLLHGENPVAMLRAAADVLRPAGSVAIIHWRTDIDTPRGPPAAFRPKPEQIIAWGTAVEGLAPDGPSFALPPWHYGLRFRRRSADELNQGRKNTG